MNIKAKKIRITFDNSSEDNWEATCGGGIEFDDAMRMIARAWREYDEPKKPAEPLIKDEKVRKIIQEWAVENDSTRAVYYSPKNELEDSYGNIISFNLILRELNHGVEYTIDELCGRG